MFTWMKLYHFPRRLVLQRKDQTNAAKKLLGEDSLQWKNTEHKKYRRGDRPTD